MTKRQTNREKQPAQQNSAGFSLIELLIVVAIILIIAAIAIPNLVRARMAANEASAAENLRTITSASVVYNTTYTNGYPPDLITLSGPPGGVANCNQAYLIDEVIAAAPNQKSGYTFSLSGAGPTVPAAVGCAAPGYNEYIVTATPMVQGVSGQRTFCSDQPNVIHFDPTGATPTTPAQCAALPTL
ncbi:MAG: prepilin-type N-terminal cleavage/methylation domain-containing protein [Candidatus Acidiferrales bacterium]